MPPVEIVEYRESWPEDFGVISEELAGVMAGHMVSIEHIGSTSVPGLCAKPVIDVMLGVGAFADVEGRSRILTELGYRYRPEYEQEIPQRRYYVRPASASIPRTHVHAVLAGGQLWRDHLALRNALQRDRQLADRYAQLKKDLARSLDKRAYTEAKGPFIRSVLGRMSGI